MSAERKILEYLYDFRNDPSKRYGGIRRGFFMLPDFDFYQYQTLANKCSELKKRGLVKKGKNNEYYITTKGIYYIEENKSILKSLNFIVNEKLPKNLIVMYHIPQDQKKERDWFRCHLKKLNFEMIQKSVWLGPSPLPKEFLEYVEDVGIKDNFKTFKLSKKL